MSLVFTQLAADSFQRADEDPLSQGGNWSTGVVTGLTVEIANDECINASGLTGVGANAFYTGISWPSNQYIQVQINAWKAGFSALDLDLGVLNFETGYQFLIQDFNEPAGTVAFSVFDIAANRLIAAQQFETTIAIGDVFLAAATQTANGTDLNLYRNGQLVLTAVGSTSIPTTGFPGFLLSYNGAASSTAIINFAAGTLTVPPSGRFTFHEHPNSTSSAVLYDVVDSGDSKTVGQVFWDNIVARWWSFNLRENQPFVAAGSSDAADIQVFAAALPSPNIITVYDSTVPASTRFKFTPVQRRAGQAVLQYLVSDGPSIAYGSIGQIIWDGVFNRWAFLQTNASTEIMAAADVNCIVNFTAGLSLISPNKIQL